MKSSLVELEFLTLLFKLKSTFNRSKMFLNFYNLFIFKACVKNANTMILIIDMNKVNFFYQNLFFDKKYNALQCVLF